jgi:hypothetical protein
MRFHFRRRVRQPVVRVAGSSALKTLAAGAVFLLIAAGAFERMGYPVPGVSEVLEYLQSVGRLADVLS